MKGRNIIIMKIFKKNIIVNMKHKRKKWKKNGKYKKNKKKNKYNNN